MSKYVEHGVKIEAGQILNPDCFPPPNELVCIQVPKVFDQVALRDCVTRCIPLGLKPREDEDERHHHHHDVCVCPPYSFEGATDFDIVEVKVISKTDSLTKPGFKKLKLFIRIRYTIHYSDGQSQFCKDDEATFNLTVNEIYCPNCIAQVGVVKSPDEFWSPKKAKTADLDGTFIKVEALAEAFNDAINHRGILTLDIGVFFIVKCECVVQLLIPAYGYCPVPPEQSAGPIQNCTIFNDKTKTPFPTQFFPDQKWNPLDKKYREEDG
ncbi:MAG: hypothetical protein N2489_05035 [Clostridia bacterium]|nr:hypothetical protein [Clostridia bacterium]